MGKNEETTTMPRSSEQHDTQAKRIVIAGFGETGLLTAVNLRKYDRTGSRYAITGIAPRPCLLSGQELGARITQPEQWQRNYLTEFDDYTKLDGVTIRQALVTAVRPDTQTVELQDADGRASTLPYDVLVIASGVRNGFWRTVGFEDKAALQTSLRTQQQQLKSAQHIAVIGGGAAGVSAAYNLAAHYPSKTIDLYFSRELPLPGYHDKVRAEIAEKLRQAGVRLHANHRARIPDGFNCDALTAEPVEWQTGQAPAKADCVLWAVGRVQPNSAHLPADMLDDKGFVKVDAHLRVQGYDNIFAVGDIAASDAFRSSARNWGFELIAKNIHAHCTGKALKTYQATDNRWGSILGVQDNGLTVYQSSGDKFRFPKWSIDRVLFPFFVRKMIYKGMRKRRD